MRWYAAPKLGMLALFYGGRRWFFKNGELCGSVPDPTDWVEADYMTDGSRWRRLDDA